jgi:coenzyme PQQ precursor peptide PqqA
MRSCRAQGCPPPHFGNRFISARNGPTQSASKVRHGACVTETCLRSPVSCRADGMTLYQLMEKAPMQWTTPSFTDMRFGFEITMYIATR